MKTSPEDWWYPVACRVAKAIDKTAKSSNRPKRCETHLFLMKARKGLLLKFPSTPYIKSTTMLYFRHYLPEIRSRIKVPEFADEMKSDFTTSARSHRIASQINLMASLQEFFEYGIRMFGCGIKGAEILGEDSDWENLNEKLTIRKLLESLEDELLSEGISLHLPGGIMYLLFFKTWP
jgi:hypothetical protein